jgi:hypothetical protein
MACWRHTHRNTPCMLGLVHSRHHRASRARWWSPPSKCQGCQNTWVGSQSSKKGRVAGYGSHCCSIQGPGGRRRQRWGTRHHATTCQPK